jgi:hypothetical protein
VQATENVHVLRVNVSQYTGAYSPNVFAVVDSGEAVIIDAGFPDDASIDSRLDYLKALGGPRRADDHHAPSLRPCRRRLSSARGDGRRHRDASEEERLLHEAVARTLATIHQQQYAPRSGKGSSTGRWRTAT